MIIYIVINKINKKIYIGKTTKSLDRRIKQHYNDVNINRLTWFHKALKKYNKKDFIWLKIESAKDKNDLNNKEKYWIKFFKKKNIILYNLTDGGDGGSRKGILNHNYGRTIPLEVRKKIAKTLTGRKVPLEVIEKIKAKAKIRNKIKHRYIVCRYCKKEFDTLICNKRKVFCSIKCCKSFWKGRKNPLIAGKNNPSAKRIICLNNNKIFDYMKLAAQEYNLDLSSIVKCCKGKINNTKGYQFNYY